MFVFRQAIDEAFVALQAGQNVRLSGKRLGGRTTLLNSVVTALEASSVPVLGVRGSLVGRDQAGYGVEQIRANLGFTLRTKDAMSAVDGIAGALGANWVIAVDDPHLIDPLTLRVLSAVRNQAGLRFISTEVVGRPQDRDFPAAWPERLIRVPDLDLPATGALLHDLLGGPIDPLVAARLYGKSGGIIGILVALAEAARNDGLLESVDGVWRGVSGSLWSPSVAALLDGLLAELDPAESSLIRWLAENGPVDVSQLVDAHGQDTVERGLELRYVSPAGSENSMQLQVWPPVLATRFEDIPRIVRRERAAMLQDPSAAAPVRSAQPGLGNELALLARSFRMHDAAALEQALAAWTSDPSPKNASGYLSFALGNRSERRTVLRVLSETTEGSASPDLNDVDLLFRRAQWLIFDENTPALAQSLFAHHAAAHPGLAATLDAGLTVLLVLHGDAAPAHYPAPTTPPTPVVQLSRMFLALIAGDLSTWDDDLKTTVSMPQMDWLQDYATPRISYLRGSVSEALELALQKRSLAKDRLDRSAFVVLSYLAVLCAHHLGDYALIRRLLSEVTVIGRPRPVLDAFYGAIFVMGAMDAHFSGRHQVREDMLLEAASVSPEVGPFLGMGLDFTNAILEAGSDAERFDEAMATAVAARVKKGFIVGAIQTALTALTISWGDHTADQLATAYGNGNLPLFTNAVALCNALRTNKSSQELEQWARSVHIGDDSHILTQLLGSSARRAEREGDSGRSAALLGVAAQFFGRAPGENELTLSDSASQPDLVTKRERQVGMLAGRLTNTEIAERLGISSRTVENHIANARRKTHTATRIELADVLLSHLTQ
ncbi:regulatory LuxR family protein [Leucobacter luti]|uniref:helix-turn-helix transcriptional regulator n=1 Tax=Leucobacter luti TaxID=340320 RepID=UPI0010519460|nr:helix-turn-helix transcriptional regulator [Leucobacter luti]MCW2289055.1 DNA-binding CsgD family transcriptional regulator [Leucobacter luti]TCK35544.1 regulatory LuxR family protein [Leucobacter luti]